LIGIRTEYEARSVTEQPNEIKSRSRDSF